MAKRPTNDNKNIQLELIPTEETKATFNAVDVTRSNFRSQAILIGKLYRQLNRQIDKGELSIDEIKKAGDTLRNLGIWNKTFWEGMTQVEMNEAEKIIAVGGEIDFSKMSDEELREWI